MASLGVTHGQVFGTPVAEYLLPRLVRERVALAGEAAHVASPMTGAEFQNALLDVASLAARRSDRRSRPAPACASSPGPHPADRQAGPLLTGSRIGRQPGRNKGPHAPSWNLRELRVTHERCHPVLRHRPLDHSVRQVPGSPHAQSFLSRRYTELTSSIAPKDEDSSRELWSRCRFAVRRPDCPVASPRSHGMPRRGFVLGRPYARLAVADNSNIPSGTDISGEVKRRFLPGLKAGVSTPRS